VFVLCWFVVAPHAGAADRFELADKDCVVLIGSTLIEREQEYGYWETELTRRNPDKSITFRNLGWSGDTVFGESRAGFDTPREGFKHLCDHVIALKPTVIIIGYGANESFAGAAGLTRFKEGYKGLLDALAPARARLVLLSPKLQENVGPPLPDAAGHNRDVQLYREAVRSLAADRHAQFVDLYALLPDGASAKPPAPLTEDGLHFTDWGYWRSAGALTAGLGWPAERWRIAANADGRVTMEGGTIKPAKAKEQRCSAAEKGEPADSIHAWEVEDRRLPAAMPPGKQARLPPDVRRTVAVAGLAPGTYRLTIDSKPVASGTADAWARGVVIAGGPEFDQVEALRRAIIEKNRLYFHRWRPQNETYLFGFRKYEQGQNAREIPLFDPLVEKMEKGIARLCRPLPHRYVLTKGHEKAS
jgi:lysophospholipase L1-like esterase